MDSFNINDSESSGWQKNNHLSDKIRFLIIQKVVSYNNSVAQVARELYLKRMTVGKIFFQYKNQNRTTAMTVKERLIKKNDAENWKIHKVSGWSKF